MIIKPLSTEVAVDDATIAASRLVRVVNKHATDASVLAIANAAATEMTLLAQTSEVIEKDIGAVITATGGTVVATPVAFTN
tara:strand:+ start:1085 stop:1327 length:243 start_codon:yes stop_codon:yes gene_type:complete